MAKKPISQKKAEKQQMESAALRQVFYVFLLGLAAECYLLIVYRNYVISTVEATLAWHTVLKAAIYVGMALLAAGIGVGIWKRSCPKCRKAMPVVAAVGLFLTVSSWVSTAFFPDGVTIMCIAVPILTLMGLVFLLYQHECFLSTITLAGALFASWVCASGLVSAWRVRVIAGAVCSIIAVAVLAVLTYKAQQARGKLMGIQVFSPECDYRVLYAVFVVSVAAIAVSLLAPGVVYYVMWAVGIALFAELVYYTTRLM